MRKFIAGALSVAALAGGLAPAASAAINTPNNNGHPSTNPAGNCPAGQNKDDTPGALNKC